MRYIRWEGKRREHRNMCRYCWNIFAVLLTFYVFTLEPLTKYSRSWFMRAEFLKMTCSLAKFITHLLGEYKMNVSCYTFHLYLLLLPLRCTRLEWKILASLFQTRIFTIRIFQFARVQYCLRFILHILTGVSNISYIEINEYWFMIRCRKIFVTRCLFNWIHSS